MNGVDISFSGGNVGIGTGSDTLTSTLQIKGETGVDYLHIRNSATNFIDFKVTENAGIAIGSFTPSPPLNGIQV